MARIRRPGALLALFALSALLLTACGGSATATIVPSAAPSAAASAPTSTGTTASAAPSSSASGGASSAASAAPGGSTAASAPAASASSGAGATPGGTPVASGATSGAGTPAATAGEKYKIVPDKSKATYKVGETFVGQGFNLAEGSTGDINGELTIDRTNPSKSTIGPIRVDISKLASDSERRDDQIRGGWLESTKFPIATFTTKRLEGLPTGPYTDGQELKFKIIGDMTIRTTTKELTFDATAKIVGGVLTGTAVAKFNMTDFGFDPPSILGFLNAENAVELTMTLQATRQP